MQTLDLADLEQHRVALTGYCYRMLGSSFDAEDAVQETMTRAWRGYEKFEGRSSLRSWLFRIATNVCFDTLNASRRRALPMDLGPSGKADGPLGPQLADSAWILPVPDARVLSASAADPAEQVAERESIRLAFIAALQLLPPKQRAVLILRDVLRWPAAEVAELLDTSVASANSALQRARATLEESNITADDADAPLSDADRELLDRYLDAFERYDMDLLAEVILEDAFQSMPPYVLWLQGRDEMFKFWLGPGAACRGSKLIPTVANGMPAFGQYKPSGPGGRLEPWSLQVLRLHEGRIAEMTFFLDTPRIFPLFGLPPRPEE